MVQLADNNHDNTHARAVMAVALRTKRTMGPLSQIRTWRSHSVTRPSHGLYGRSFEQKYYYILHAPIIIRGQKHKSESNVLPVCMVEVR